MRALIVLLFIAVPIAEIAVLIKVGEAIGVALTVLLVILTAVIGVALLKQQGVATLATARAALEAGRVPVEPVIEGLCLLVAGAFLLTPGLITDAAGFALLVPRLRRAIAATAFARLRQSGVFDTRAADDGAGRTERPDGRGPIIEGEYTTVDERAAPEEDAADRGRARRKGARPSPWSRRR